MNHFFEQEVPMEVLWHDIPEIPAVDSTFRPRAFVPYARPGGEFSTENGRFQQEANHRNSTRRMIELLKAIWAASVDRRERESSQGYRHMIKERRRREKMKHNYSDLLSMLPPGTKSDNKAVVQAAASHLINLEGLKEELQRRNMELQASLERQRDTSSEAANVEFQIVDQSSRVGLVIEIMKHLKNRGLKVRAIRSMPSNGGLKVSVETVNEASGNALTEVQQQVASDFVEASNGEAAESRNFWRGDVA